MASYKVLIAPSGLKDLERLPSQVVRRVEKRIDLLAVQPFPPGVEKLSGGERAYRMRAGDYRIVCDVDTRARMVLILRVRHRRQVYRNL